MTRTLLFSGLAVVAATAGCARSHTTTDAAVDRGPELDVGGKTPLGMSCAPGTDPTTPLLTDFSTATYSAAKGKWGIDGNLTGTVFSFKDSGSTAATKVENQALVISGQVAANAAQDPFAGGGLQFDVCVNTALYAGFQFTLSGTASGCDVYFQLQTYAEQPTLAKGGCASYCNKFPQKKVVPHLAATTVLFSDLVDSGNPASAAAMAAQMLGVRWKVQTPDGVDAGAPPCTFSLNVSDVSFVK